VTNPIYEADEYLEDDTTMGRFSKSPNKPGVKRTFQGYGVDKNNIALFSPG
jgi:hypothetical protein